MNELVASYDPSASSPNSKEEPEPKPHQEEHQASTRRSPRNINKKVKYNEALSKEDIILDAITNRCEHLVAQIYTYMIDFQVKYGVVTNYKWWWFLKEENRTLYISKCVGSSFDDPFTVLQALAAFAFLAMKQSHT